MNDFADTQRLGIGGNNPPIHEILPQKYEDFTRLADELLTAAASAPARVDDDETSGQFAELAKKMRELEKAFNTAFDGEKAPHQTAITQISGFFKTWTDKLEKERRRIADTNKDYNERKKAAEQKRLAAIAQQKREEEDRKRREALDAAQTKAAAQSALEEFERLSREAEEAKASATSEVEQAQAQVASCEAKFARVKADNSAIAAVLAQRVVDGNPETDENKAAKRAECEANLKVARDDLEAARQLLTSARQRAKDAKEAARRAEEDAAAKKSEVKTAEREEKSATAEANRNARAAETLEQKVEKDDPAMGSTRSLLGAMATTMDVWKHSVVDVSKLDKEALWHLISFDAIEVAVGKWAKLQPDERRKMDGANFWKETVAVVR